MGWLLLSLFSWSGLSILWSEDPALTVRHVSVLVFCSLAALGIARQLTLRELCLLALVVTAVHIVNGIRTELTLGTFHPLAADYRFAGTVHPNVQGPYCALLALSAGFLAGRVRRGRLVLWSICLAAVVLLLLTKSRTVCAALVVGVLVYQSCRLSWHKWLAITTTVVGSLAALGCLGLLLTDDLEDQAAKLVLIGRPDEADSLSGRVPLWQELVPHAAENLLLGHGYATFWSPRGSIGFPTPINGPSPMDTTPI